MSWQPGRLITYWDVIKEIEYFSLSFVRPLLWKANGGKLETEGYGEKKISTEQLSMGTERPLGLHFWRISGPNGVKP